MECLPAKGRVHCSTAMGKASSYIAEVGQTLAIRTQGRLLTITRPRLNTICGEALGSHERRVADEAAKHVDDGLHSETLRRWAGRECVRWRVRPVAEGVLKWDVGVSGARLKMAEVSLASTIAITTVHSLGPISLQPREAL